MIRHTTWCISPHKLSLMLWFWNPFLKHVVQMWSVVNFLTAFLHLCEKLWKSPNVSLFSICKINIHMISVKWYINRIVFCDLVCLFMLSGWWHFITLVNSTEHCVVSSCQLGFCYCNWEIEHWCVQERRRQTDLHWLTITDPTVCHCTFVSFYWL